MSETSQEFTIEHLDRVLSYPTIKVVPTPNPGKHFDRERHFLVDGVSYHIEWYNNICYLNSPGNVLIPFQVARVTNTWPRRSKMNIQFYDSRGEVCCILKIEDY